MSNNFNRKTTEMCLSTKICLYVRNLFQATCKRWVNSIFALAGKLPRKLRTRYSCIDSAGIISPIFPHKSINSELSTDDVVTIFVFPEFSCKPQTANSGINEKNYVAIAVVADVEDSVDAAGCQEVSCASRQMWEQIVVEPTEA